MGAVKRQRRYRILYRRRGGNPHVWEAILDRHYLDYWSGGFIVLPDASHYWLDKDSAYAEVQYWRREHPTHVFRVQPEPIAKRYVPRASGLHPDDPRG